MQRLFLITIFLSVFLAGCSSTPDDDPTYGMTAAQIYQEAKSNIQNANYETAIQYYEKLESRFPYGNYATRAQMEVAYAYYKFDEHESAILAAERFIKLHPNHPHVDYLYYIRGLASYTMNSTFLGKLFDQDPTERDPKAARRSFQFFAELVKKFPKSKYTRDSIQRMTHLRNGLAKYEVHVAKFYFDREAYLAAANRGKYVIDNYQSTPAVADALALMVKSYRKLEMKKLAGDAFRVLELNHPNHPELAQLKNQ
ncbi:MAG: outer membrane protein assembly factor BamD [Gammaproteobacteria bacterium]|nr:outer membrane protein assembly factor BamD [Gammaproteobacteria bacterium]MDH5776834.1 outer membrane protein assembly factor BamD [Gammaproteobacteria bacterium]